MDDAGRPPTEPDFADANCWWQAARGRWRSLRRSTTRRSRANRACRSPSRAKFAHGVAAGFPSPKGVTLWTRVSEL